MIDMMMTSEEEKEAMKLEFIFTDTCPDSPPAKEVVERVMEDYEDLLEVEFLRAKDNPDLVNKYDITHIPTIVIDGEVEFVESVTETKLRTKIEEALDA